MATVLDIPTQRVTMSPVDNPLESLSLFGWIYVVDVGIGCRDRGVLRGAGRGNRS